MSADADSWLTGLTDDKSPLPDVRVLAHPEAVRECRVETREVEVDRKQLTKMQRRLASSSRFVLPNSAIDTKSSHPLFTAQTRSPQS